MKIRRSDEEFIQQLSRLLKAEGISGLGVAEIAARLRCSRRRLYQVAPTKEGLLVAVAELAFAQARSSGEEGAAREKFASERIRAYMRAGIELAQTLSEAFQCDLEALPAGRAAFDDYQAVRARGLRQLIEEGMRRGELKKLDSLVASEVMFGAASRIRRPEFLSAAGMTLTEAVEAATDIILNGMLSKPQKPGTIGTRFTSRSRASRVLL